ncbi:unnamed protein product [Vitrella brassicaformis CCMP3155]|uniref:Uncharacterized protein n=1 Tax=Vitrella brassicaformis (strain CCMP3155) TaxID=1169540 RepID=A0A0G4FYG0_VITBC|nr:unnamed protein product [Vitrella brassicaformis CCMP3155]|eukprot:CEM20050.1 unnamed protein product [Vitrella brassicaformis CCMP3155]
MRIGLLSLGDRNVLARAWVQQLKSVLVTRFQSHPRIQLSFGEGVPSSVPTDVLLLLHDRHTDAQPDAEPRLADAVSPDALALHKPVVVLLLYGPRETAAGDEAAACDAITGAEVAEVLRVNLRKPEGCIGGILQMDRETEESIDRIASLLDSLAPPLASSPFGQPSGPSGEHDDLIEKQSDASGDIAALPSQQTSGRRESTQDGRDKGGSDKWVIPWPRFALLPPTCCKWVLPFSIGLSTGVVLVGIGIGIVWWLAGGGTPVHPQHEHPVGSTAGSMKGQSDAGIMATLRDDALTLNALMLDFMEQLNRDLDVIISGTRDIDEVI